MKTVTLTILPFLCLLNSVVAGLENPIVNTPLGKIRGFYETSLNGRRFYSFEGVPYAKPPIGERRFKPPVPLDPWPGIWEAKTVYKCLGYVQFAPEGNKVQGEEDCLYINIYTPTLDPYANLDVVFFIHGGAFMFNFGAFQEPNFILNEDVVYISVNYRLGPLGFLSTEDNVVPGNNGILDQIQALKWIQRYVKYFGGNPKSVTITGMSAGGASVHIHYLSPLSKGLFHRGISQSGVALNEWVLMEAPLEKSRKLAATVGCPTINTTQLVDCLRTRNGRQIVESVKEFLPFLQNPFSPFAVVVDDWASNPVLPDHPYNLIRNRKFTDLPWIASHTDSEGLYPGTDFYPEEYLEEIDTRWNELIPHILDFNYTVVPQRHREVSEKIRKHYMKNQRLTRESYMDFIKVMSDRFFITDIHKTLRMQSSLMKSPVYFYYFSYRGAHSMSEKAGNNEDFGAAHFDDTSYIFQNVGMNTTSTLSDKAMVRIFVKLFVSFAKNGVPKVPAMWPPLSKRIRDPLVYLHLDSPYKISSKTTPLITNERFWDSLPIMENGKLFE